MDTKFRELPHPPLPRGFPTALGRVGDNGFQILFQDNAQIKLKKGEGVPGVRDLKCMKLYPLGIAPVYPDGEIQS